MPRNNSSEVDQAPLQGEDSASHNLWVAWSSNETVAVAEEAWVANRRTELLERSPKAVASTVSKTKTSTS